MPASQPPKPPLSLKLTPQEKALLLALRAHFERRACASMSMTAVIRLALEALAEAEKINGFEHK